MSFVKNMISVCCLVTLAGGLSSCVPAVIMGGGSAGAGVVEEGGVGGAATDTRIRMQISSDLLQKSESLYHAVNLNVRGGRVLITGSVETEELKETAGTVAEKTEGVTQVYNELQLAKAGGVLSYSNDVLISRSLKSRLVFDKSVFSVNYDVDVIKGVVYILGVAQNELEREQVIAHARDMSDVKRVVPYIILKDEMDRDSAK